MTVKEHREMDSKRDRLSNKKDTSIKTIRTRTSERLVQKAEQIYAQGIIEKIKHGKINPKKITAAERRACVAIMRHRPITKTATAAFLGIARNTLESDLKIIREGMGILVEGLTVEAIIGDFRDKYEHLYARATLDGDTALAWRIAVDSIKVMQDLGYVRKVIGEFTEADAIDRMGDKELGEFVDEELEFFKRAEVTVRETIRIRRRAKGSKERPAERAVVRRAKTKKKGVIEI